MLPPRRRSRTFRDSQERKKKIPEEPEKLPAPLHAHAQTDDSFGEIARYLVLADVALTEEHANRTEKSAGEAARAEEVELERRMRQLIERYRTTKREAVVEINNPHRKTKDGGELQKTG